MPSRTDTERAAQKPAVDPAVLAVGGADSLGDVAGDAMKLAASDADHPEHRTSAYWLAEEAPNQVLAALTAFLMPYRRK
jgi:hypothetical protein